MKVVLYSGQVNKYINNVFANNLSVQTRVNVQTTIYQPDIGGKAVNTKVT